LEYFYQYFTFVDLAQVEDSSFNQIIEQATPPKFDPAVLNEMILTYRSICGAEELLQAIIKAYFSLFC